MCRWGGGHLCFGLELSPTCMVSGYQSVFSQVDDGVGFRNGGERHTYIV